MNSPLASVIVPVYNVSPYLSECAASICGQTYSNLEIILVDDGSSDGSGALCDELAEKDPRVQVIHQENRGVSAARNAGLNAASGTYIYFVDGDDWVGETLVEETAAVMERGGYDCCTWGHTLEDGESVYFGRRREIVFRFPAEEEKRRFLCRWVVPCRLDWSVCNRVFRREIIQRNGLRFAEEQALFEDLDFSFRYLACCTSSGSRITSPDIASRAARIPWGIRSVAPWIPDIAGIWRLRARMAVWELVPPISVMIPLICARSREAISLGSRSLATRITSSFRERICCPSPP